MSGKLDRRALESAWADAEEALREHAPELGPITRTAIVQVVIEAALPAYLSVERTSVIAPAEEVNPKALEAACRAHAPQWDGIDPEIQVYARQQMQAAIQAYFEEASKE